MSLIIVEIYLLMPHAHTYYRFTPDSKSTLIHQAMKTVKDTGGFAIEAEFNKSSRPDTVLTSALNVFFGEIRNKVKEHSFVSMRWRIKDAIGTSGYDVLMEAIPNLYSLLRDGDASSTDDLSQESSKPRSSTRLKFMLCKLIGAISTREHPLVLVLDDLQWADSSLTLDVMRMILVDPDIKYLLLFGAYRDDEVVSMSHPLMETIREIQQCGVNFVSIKLGQIEKESINSLISDALCLPPRLCKSLSTVVHNKAGGIIMFVLRFLSSLNDEGLLRYSMSSRRWEFNLEKIQYKEISDDVVQLMTHQMARDEKLRVRAHCHFASLYLSPV